MAGNDDIEPEELTAGIGGLIRTHGEAVADRKDADRRLIELVDELHVHRDPGVARNVEGLCVFGLCDDDEARGIAKIDRRALDRSR